MPLSDIDTGLERETLEHLAGSPGFENLTFASALEIRARDIMNETVLALTQAQDPATPPKAMLPKIPNVHIASQGSPFRRSSALAHSTPPNTIHAAPHKTIQSKSQSADYRIEPFASLPPATACRNLNIHDRNIVLERKKQHVQFLLAERERLERVHESIKAQMKRLPRELKSLQAEIDQMVKEDDIIESSDEDWLYTESKAKGDRRGAKSG